MKKYNKKRMSATFIVLSLILCVSIGYAVLTTALKINSKMSLGAASFDIHFDNIGASDHKATVNEEAEITNDAKTQISFDVVLPRISDYYKFTTDIVNEGSIPGVIKTIELNGLTESQKKLINYKVTYTTSGNTLAIGDYIGPYSSKNVTVEVIYELSNDVTVEDLPSSTLDLECEFVINFENGDLATFRQRAAANRLMQDVDYFPTSFLDFTKPSKSDEHGGIYRLDGTENDDFPIYFYRGDNGHVLNHVLFGGYCWRIIRTTETGGIKLIYNGSPNADGQCTTLSGDGILIGYHSFTPTVYDQSNLKMWISTWYFEHLIKYQAYLEDTPFCNGSYSTGDISLSCNDEDTISISNGRNNYPIGMISAQEANLCGLIYGDPNSNSWLSAGGSTRYRTMSKSGGSNYYIDSNYIYSYDPSYNYGIRPVVSLNSEVVLSGGAGTTTNPYTVSLG